MGGSQKYILAIDLGTSGPKVAVLNAAGVVLHSAFEPTATRLLGSGGAEQEPAEWWQAITSATARLHALVPELRQHLAAIGVTAQWSGTVAVDAAGLPLMPAIIWMDSRGAAHTRAQSGGVFNVMGYAPAKALHWIRLTGGAPGHAGKDSFSHVQFIKHERPEIYAKTATFFEPKDYLNFCLTGERVACFDSVALYWLTDNRDPDRIAYHPRLLALAEVDRAKFPELRHASEVIGKLSPSAAAELGLPAGTPVVGGAPDVHAAALGAGTVKSADPHLYIGTSSWLSAHVPHKKTDLFNNMAALPAALKGRYLLLNEQQTAGACLNYLRDQLLCRRDELAPATGSDVFPLFDRLAERAPAGSAKLIFTPWLYGERTPVEDRSLRGGFHNLSLGHNREHLIRAVLEGVAYNSRWLLRSVEAFIGRKVPSLRMVGGGAKSDLWCQIFADVLDVPIERVREPLLATVRGAGLLALVGLGELAPDDIPACVQVERRFEPVPQNVAVYAELYQEFLGLYQRNKGMFARLNR